VHNSISQPIPSQVINWNKNKARDRLLTLLEKHSIYSVTDKDILCNDRENCKINLGIVSRLARLKRFPELLTQLSPILYKYPSICLHIFGSGSYREVNNIKKATLLLKDRTFFWGWQDNPYAAYKFIDYLLLGRPEHEALGLNVLEAQAAGIKSIAINGGPFPETIEHNSNGWLYRDPKHDHAASFDSIIKLILESGNQDNATQSHIVNPIFSYESFASTLRIITNTITIKFNTWKHSKK